MRTWECPLELPGTEELTSVQDLEVTAKEVQAWQVGACAPGARLASSRH